MKCVVKLVCGAPASGKSRIAKDYAGGMVRLNRDTEGGTVAALLPKLDVLLSQGKSVILDNLYATKASRAEVIKLAKKHGASAGCVWVDTSLEDAQFNACVRMVERYGRVLHPEDHKKAPYKDDPNAFPVAVLYKYRKEFEAPSLAEGFDDVSKIKFSRIYPPDWTNKAVIFDFDGTLREHRGGGKYPTDPSQVVVPPGRSKTVKEWIAKGYLILGASNQSGIAKGELTAGQAKACFDQTCKLLGVEIDYKYCPHKVPPITCYCRKPGSGMGVELIMKYKLDPRQCIFVGDMGTDASFAKRCGFMFKTAQEFFNGSSS